MGEATIEEEQSFCTWRKRFCAREDFPFAERSECYEMQYLRMKLGTSYCNSDIYSWNDDLLRRIERRTKERVIELSGRSDDSALCLDTKDHNPGAEPRRELTLRTDGDQSIKFSIRDKIKN